MVQLFLYYLVIMRKRNSFSPVNEIMDLIITRKQISAHKTDQVSVSQCRNGREGSCSIFFVISLFSPDEKRRQF